MALAIATAHGYDTSAVTFVTPYAGDANRFQVSVAQPVPTRLLSLLNFKAFNISGRAVSAVQSGVVSQALLALDPTKCGAASLTGSASINIHNGGMQVNSNCATALTATGAASVDVQSSSLHIVGNYTTTGSASLTPTPVTGVAVVADPLASLAAPAGGTLQGSVNCAGSTTMTIPPGIYPGITAGASCTLTMQPGIYILKGGGLQVSGAARVNGNGVFIYNAGSNFPSTGGTFGPISLTGSGILDLTPQTTGPYAGLLFFQSRDNTRPLTVSGAAALSGLQGTVYGVQMEVDISGSGTLPAQFIVGSVTITGGGSITVEYTPSQVFGIPSTALVE